MIQKIFYDMNSYTLEPPKVVLVFKLAGLTVYKNKITDGTYKSVNEKNLYDLSEWEKLSDVYDHRISQHDVLRGIL